MIVLSHLIVIITLIIFIFLILLLIRILFHIIIFIFRLNLISFLTRFRHYLHSNRCMQLPTNIQRWFSHTVLILLTLHIRSLITFIIPIQIKIQPDLITWRHHRHLCNLWLSTTDYICKHIIRDIIRFSLICVDDVIGLVPRCSLLKVRECRNHLKRFKMSHSVIIEQPIEEILCDF